MKIILGRFIPSRLRIWLLNWSNYFRSREKQKVFCIGRNKTGTTSVKKAFELLGYPVGHQRTAERLHYLHYFNGEFDEIVDYCKFGQVFQDVPFSCPETYKYLDKAFPGSKFILTVRDNGEQWYRSITRFHGKLWGKNGQTPTAQELKDATYVFKGAPYNLVALHGTTDEEPYHKETMIAHYEQYNQEIIDYFKDRPDDLLVINIAEEGAYQRFIAFLGVDSPYDDFPWENKT